MTSPTDFVKPEMRPTLTPDEARTIQLFVAVLPDNGIDAALSLEVVDSTPSGSSSAAVTQRLAAAQKALEDVVDTFRDDDPESIFGAAPSLKIITMFMRQTTFFAFPLGFIPTESLVKKCLDGYYAVVLDNNS
ncbi:MAG: hypothetical protein ACQR33_00035 [Candidatus Saccharibacteria bacterium]